MRPLAAILAHPITLVFVAVVTGMAVHSFTSSSAWLSDTPESLPVEPELTPEARLSPTLPAEPVEPSVNVAEAAPAAEETDVISLPPRPSLDGLAPLRFREIWGYLMAGEDDRWIEEAPITDVCLFNFRLGDRGEILGNLQEKTLRLARQRGVRAHLVIASSGQKSLLHFLLNPYYRARNQFIGDIVRVARRHKIDGLQLDFESLLVEDRFHFIAFVQELRSQLPAGISFSLALPAEVKTSPKRPLRYRGLERLADRYFIMIYDEHWKGGTAGSIASKSWHDKVVDHAVAELPREKIVFGLPLYGRIWQHQKIARATRHSALQRFVEERNAAVHYDVSQTHHFTFQEVVTGECWFEDAATLYEKFFSAYSRGARAIGFWRIGQEDPRVWKLLAQE